MELNEWLKSEFITPDDEGKWAVIISRPEIREGRLGARLYFEVETEHNGKHERKMVGCGKLQAREYAKQLGEDLSKWVGAKGKIIVINVYNPDKKAIQKKAVFELVR